MPCLAFIVMLVVLSVIGWVIDVIAPGRVPFGWLGSIVAAIIGGLLGGLIFGAWGPSVSWGGWTLSFIPALLGAIILGFILRLLMGSATSRRSL